MNNSSLGAGVVGRYALHGVLARGGMATVHIGRLLGQVGFSRTVAIKRLHPQFAEDPEFVAMFLDEARLAARVRHPNAVPVIDVVATNGEVLLVMEYVQGETLARLITCANDRHEKVPPAVVAAILCDALDGLHAAHEARDELGLPLGIVHRDVSPQNLIVGVDGVARVLDFGIAKAAGRSHVTREGELKGKLAYMSPEQLNGKTSRQSDIYAVGVVLWESLVGQRLYAGSNEGETITKILTNSARPPSEKGSPKEYDEVVMKALCFSADERFATAREMSMALAKIATRAEPHEVGAWVESVAKDLLATRAGVVASVESAPVLFRPEDAPALPAPTTPPSLPDGTATRASLTRENALPNRRVITPAVAAVLIAIAIGGGLAVRVGTSPGTSPASSAVAGGGATTSSTTASAAWTAWTAPTTSANALRSGTSTGEVEPRASADAPTAAPAGAASTLPSKAAHLSPPPGARGGPAAVRPAAAATSAPHPSPSPARTATPPSLPDHL